MVQLLSTTLQKTSNDFSVYDAVSNVVGTIKLLNLSLPHGVRKSVFLSFGGAVYGPSVSCPIFQTDATEPICS